jgi:hypothetical protein
MENNNLIPKEPHLIKYEVISYRDKIVEFLSDISGDYYFARLDGELVDLGFHPISPKETLQRFIDRRMDLITEFRDYPDLEGSILTYFNNGGFRDIALKYKGRLLKIFIVTGSVNEIQLISESIRMLRTSGLLDEI